MSKTKTNRGRGLYQLTFYYNEDDNVWSLNEFCGGGEMPDKMNMLLFGSKIAESGLLSDKDKMRLAEFCKQYLAELNKLKNKDNG